MQQLIGRAEPTAVGVLALVVLLILFGLLIPVRQLRRELQREREIAEFYRKASDAQDARNDRLMELLAEAMRRERTP